MIVIAHEWGHYFTAKSFGVKVNEFAIGMGPKILKIQKGETLFSIRALPLGGFCAMEGEDEESNDPKSFNNKKPWQKIIVVAMGAIMNLVLGFLITFIIFIQKPEFASTKISKFSEEAVSQASGLQVGDEVLKVDGNSIISYKDLTFSIFSSGKSEFDFLVKRDGKSLNLNNIKFNYIESEKGVSIPEIDFLVSPIEKNLFTLISQVFLDTILTIKIVWTGLVGLITGKFSLNMMSGPIGVASTIGQTTVEGMKSGWKVALNGLLALISMITINLGVMNLLPIPALDGGRLLFLLFELITKKKLNPKYECWIHFAGFALLILLMIFISFNDIMRLFGK